MSSSPVRAAMVPVTRQIRAYFAPMNRTAGTPTIFDPGKYGAFLLGAPPAPWLDLGWVDNFQRLCTTLTEPLRAGVPGAPTAQFRGPLDARIEFDFREWGKLQMALACGSEHMNVLASECECPAFRWNTIAGRSRTSGIDSKRDHSGRGSGERFLGGEHCGRGL